MRAALVLVAENAVMPINGVRKEECSRQDAREWIMCRSCFERLVDRILDEALVPYRRVDHFAGSACEGTGGGDGGAVVERELVGRELDGVVTMKEHPRFAKIHVRSSGGEIESK